MTFNHNDLFQAISQQVPDAMCLIVKERRLTYAAVAERVNRLGNLLLRHGITVHAERDTLAPWEAGQDLVALYLHNGTEYVEGVLGACAARAASFNVNYRYVEDELAYLLNDAQAAAVVYHARFAPALGAVLDRLERTPLLLQVHDESGNALLSGALDYEAALAASSPKPPDIVASPDDLHIVYTGGTTGMPKGTLWRQGDLLHGAISRFMTPGALTADSVDAAAQLVAEAERQTFVPLSPLMHGGAQWITLAGVLTGAKVAFPAVVDRLDPVAAWKVIAEERANLINLVGTAFARPMCDEFERGGHDASSLRFVTVSGAATSPGLKRRLIELMPHITVLDVVGSSESGSQLSKSGADDDSSGGFVPADNTCIVSEDATHFLPPDDPTPGWLASSGVIPLGYLGDEAKTARTFPVVEGTRVVMPGDRARWEPGGTMELLGRDSTTINSGGEKIFAEEVELALLAHPAVEDVLVLGRPSDRWGAEVVAIVQIGDDHAPPDEELLDTASRTIARYKLPKTITRAAIVRGPAGKADYRWARALVESAEVAGA